MSTACHDWFNEAWNEGVALCVFGYEYEGSFLHFWLNQLYKELM